MQFDTQSRLKEKGNVKYLKSFIYRNNHRSCEVLTCYCKKSIHHIEDILRNSYKVFFSVGVGHSLAVMATQLRTVCKEELDFIVTDVH